MVSEVDFSGGGAAVRGMLDNRRILHNTIDNAWWWKVLYYAFYSAISIKPQVIPTGSMLGGSESSLRGAIKKQTGKSGTLSHFR